MSRAVHVAIRAAFARWENQASAAMSEEVADALAPSSIKINDVPYHGIGVCDCGVFTAYGSTYAGQIRDGYACGLGVLDHGGGYKIYAEYGPYGKQDGRHLDRYEGAAGYIMFDRCMQKEEGFVYSDECVYNDESRCAPDDPRLIALVEKVSPVEALASAAAKEAYTAVASFVADLPRRLAGLALMVSVMLARYRQPPTVASELAAELLTLPSGLISIVCEAIVR